MKRKISTSLVLTVALLLPQPALAWWGLDNSPKSTIDRLIAEEFYKIRGNHYFLISANKIVKTTAATKPKAGAVCSTVGKVQSVGSIKFKCTKSSKKYVWQEVKPKSVFTQISTWNAPAVYDLAGTAELSFNFSVKTSSDIDLPKITAIFDVPFTTSETPSQTLNIPVLVTESSRTKTNRSYQASLKLTSRDPIGTWRWKFDPLSVNGSTIAAGMPSQLRFEFTRPTFGGAVAVPVNPSPITTYNSFKKEKFQLYAWEGENLVILTKTNTLSPNIMGRILYTLNRSYQSYATQTNFRPTLFKVHNNKATIAVLGPDEVGCGAACGYLGATGIEINQGFFNRLYNGVEKFDQYDQVLFYELGRNFWDYGNYKFKLSINGLGNSETSPFWDVSITGFAVYMRYATAEVDSIPMQPVYSGNIPWPKFVADTKSLVTLQKNSSNSNFANTFQAKKQPVGGPLGVYDFWTSVMMHFSQGKDLAKFNTDFYAALYRQSTPTNTAGIVANFVAALSAAAGRDVSTEFYNELRFDDAKTLP